MKFNHKHYLSIATLAILTACGGGSSSPSNTGNGGGGGTGATSTTFAAPSTYTSSANTMDLLASIQSGGVTILPVFGLVLKQNFVMTVVNGKGTYGPSSRGYELIDADLNIGLNKIYYDDKSNGTRPKDYYLKNITNLPQPRYANSTDKDAFVIDPNINVYEPLLGHGTLQLITDANGSFVSNGLVSYVSTTSNNHAPYLSYGLKTDSNDMPTTTTVTYKAVVGAFTGDGLPYSYNDGSYINTLTTGCNPTMTLTLNTATGKLISSAISNCQTPSTLSDTLSFTLGEVYFVNSTLRKDTASASAATFTAVGRLGGNPNYADAPIVTHAVQSTKISGAIFGKGASSIVIQGSGINGAFYIMGHKQ